MASQDEHLDMSSLDIKSMQSIMDRSAEAHTQSMEPIMKSMSLTSAVQTLEKGNLSTPELMQVTYRAFGKRR